MFHSNSPLAACFTYGNIYVSVLLSLSVPPSPSPAVSTSLFCMSAKQTFFNHVWGYRLWCDQRKTGKGVALQTQLCHTHPHTHRDTTEKLMCALHCSNYTLLIILHVALSKEKVFSRLRAFTNKFFHASISQSFLLWFPNCVTPLERFSVLYSYIYFKMFVYF